MRAPLFLFCGAAAFFATTTLVNHLAAAETGMDGVALSVSLSAEAQKQFQKQLVEESGDSFPTVEYTARREEKQFVIEPRLFFIPTQKGRSAKQPARVDYLTLLEKGGPISTITFDPSYSISFPSLDLKVVNNGPKTVYFSEILLSVQSSQLDPTPLPILLSGYDQVLYFSLVNEGWQPVESCTVKFSISPKPWTKPPEKFDFEKTFGRFAEKLDIEIGDELAKAGLAAKYAEAARQYTTLENKKRDLMRAGGDTDVTEHPEFKKLETESERISRELSLMGKKALGPFAGDKLAKLFGSLTYSWKDAQGAPQSKTVLFKTDVLLAPPEGLGAPGPVTGQYETMLKREGENYTLRVPISQPVRSGNVDRFLLRLGIPCTSRHRFTVKLRSTENGVVESGPILLNGLLPRNGASFLSETKPASESSPQ